MLLTGVNNHDKMYSWHLFCQWCWEYVYKFKLSKVQNQFDVRVIQRIKTSPFNCKKYPQKENPRFLVQIWALINPLPNTDAFWHIFCQLTVCENIMQ